MLSIIYCVLNAVKPLHIDDAAYYYYAVRAAGSPLDPYGFEVYWNQLPQPAHHLLAPPVLPYWWSIAIRLFGDRPVLWKLWLFPFVVLFIFSLHGLSRRFARGLEGPLVWMTVLSPTFLPSLNLMLDVPSLALRLGGVLVFLWACDRDSLGMALAAGLACGLAIETKYTGALGPAAILLYSALNRKIRLGLIATSVAALVFVAWESFTAWRYGQSHFLYHMHVQEMGPPLEVLFETLLSLIGGLAPYVTLLGFVALGLRRLPLFTVGAALISPYILLICGSAGSSLAAHFFLLFGFIQYAILFSALAWCSGVVPDPRSSLPETERHATLFLVLWMALELGGYLVLTPFLAVRRVMGVVVIVTLLAGRLAAGRSPLRRFEVRGIAAAGIVLALLFYGVDMREAIAQKEAANRAAAWLRREGDGTAWFVGHWGFQFYAERAGMRPVVPGVSLLRRGDWLVVPDPPVNQQVVQVDHRTMRLTHTIHVRDPIPLRTVPGYYGDRSTAILERNLGSRVSLRIYAIEAESLP